MKFNFAMHVGDEIQIKMAADILDKKFNLKYFFATPASQGSSIAVDILFKQGSAKIDEEKFALS